MTSSIRALTHTIKIHMKLSLARPMFQFIIFVMPFLFATVAILIYKNATPEQIFHYVVLGSGFITLWSSIVFSSASDVNRERYYGTLELLFVTPTSFATILAGKIIGNTIWGVLSMLLSFIYLLGIYRVEISIYHPKMFIVSYIVVLLSLSVFAFFMALSFTLSRQAEALMNMMEYPIYMICGFMFPITILADWIKPLSWALPPTWSIELLRITSLESLNTDQWVKVGGILLLLTVLYLWIAIYFYRMVDRRTRIKGNLGVY